MNRLLCLVSLAFLVFFASNAHAQDATAPKVFIVGDSHVFTLGPMLRARLESSGARVLGIESRHGWSTERFRQEGDLRRVVSARGRPDVVIVCLGGNDFVRSRERYARDLRWVTEQARAAGAQQIIWLGPATSNGEASEIAATTDARHARNAALQQEILPDLGVHWIDSRPVTLAHHGRDGVHFTRTGYGLWSAGVFPAVEDRLLASALLAKA